MYQFPRDLWTAATDGAAGIDITVFAQYGILGVIAAMLIWFARGAHQRERDRADRLEAEVQRLHTLMLDRVIPALTSATNAAEESAALLAAMQRERELSNLVNLRRTTEGGQP